MRLDGSRLLAAAAKLRDETDLPEDRATWIAGLVISVYLGSDQPMNATDIAERGSSD